MIRRANLVIGICLLTVTSAQAELVTVFFTAELSTITGTPFGLTPAMHRGLIESGSFTYDTSTPDSNPGNTGLGVYNHSLSQPGWVINLPNGSQVTGSLTPYFEIEDRASIDEFEAEDGFGSASGAAMALDGVPDNDIRLGLNISNGSNPFPNDSLPNPFPYLGNSFPPHTFSLNDGANGGILWQFQTAVPEPSTWILAVIGSLGLALAAGRKLALQRAAK